MPGVQRRHQPFDHTTDGHPPSPGDAQDSASDGPIHTAAPSLPDSRRTDDLHVLWYSDPSSKWIESLPVGNGHRAAMCAGRPGTEHLWINDGTAWSGAPGPDPLAGVQARGPEHLDAVRRAIADDDVRTAERLLAELQTPWSQAYLPLAEADVTVEPAVRPETVGREEGRPGTPAQGRFSRRELDLRTGVATHRWSAPGAGEVVQETWADSLGGALVHTVRADVPVRLVVRLGGPLPPSPGVTPTAPEPLAAPGTLVHVVDLPVDVPPDHAPRSGGIRYDAQRGRRGLVGVSAVGDAAATVDDGVLRTGAATTHVLLIATATTDPPGTTDAAPAADRLAEQLVVRPVGTAHETRARLLAAHVAEHRRLYDRVTLELPSADGAADLPTDQRVAAAEQHPDPGLAALVFHHGRYLLMSSSRPGGLPATLQGLWNPWLPGPWSSAYTLNINLQMAYWAAETTGLGECHEPLLRFVRRVADGPGAHVAAELYGTRGWVAHHNSDAWGHAAPVGAGDGDASWAAWAMGGLWLCQHLVEHHRFSGDDDALRAAWPALRGAALFTVDWVQTAGGGAGHAPGHGPARAWTSPSTSPENRFVAPDGVPAAVTTSATMDVALVRWLADACAWAAALLGDVHEPWITELAQVAAALPDPRVGPRGELGEWGAALPEAEPEHRHLSHLVGLFPLGTLDPTTTPELSRAAARTIELRGRESTGWSLAWRVALWARLGRGDRAHEQVLLALRPADDGARQRGGLYPNLFSAHPPFQLDGSCGLTAGVAELLLQSHRGTGRTPHLDLLPALPEAWPDGDVTGLCARGGVRVDVTWRDRRLVRARLHAPADRDAELTVAVGGPGAENPQALDAPESSPGSGAAPRRVRLAAGDILTIRPVDVTDTGSDRGQAEQGVSTDRHALRS